MISNQGRPQGEGARGRLPPPEPGALWVVYLFFLQFCSFFLEFCSFFLSIVSFSLSFVSFSLSLFLFSWVFTLVFLKHLTSLLLKSCGRPWLVTSQLPRKRNEIEISTFKGVHMCTTYSDCPSNERTMSLSQQIPKLGKKMLCFSAAVVVVYKFILYLSGTEAFCFNGVKA